MPQGLVVPPPPSARINPARIDGCAATIPAASDFLTNARRELSCNGWLLDSFSSWLGSPDCGLLDGFIGTLLIFCAYTIDKISRGGGKSFFVNWLTIFPVLSEEMMESYMNQASEADQSFYEEWLGVDSVHASDRNLMNAPQCVSATLFWKHVNGDDPDLPKPTREMMVNARRDGLVKRFCPWESYVEPLLYHSQAAVKAHPEVQFRLYLANDLDFLIPELNELGWDVYLMKSPSIRYCPGGFWRFLPLAEEGTLVTCIDTDRMDEVSGEIARTEAMAELNLGLWRVPGYYNSDVHEQVRYRPILGGHFGARGGIPIRELIEAFIWHDQQGTLPMTANVPGIGERPLQFAKWPNYGYDEVFQLIALYPWLVENGTLTFIPNDARSMLLPADIEYALQANRNSEIIYF